LAALERRYGIDPLERFKEPIGELIGAGRLLIDDGCLRASEAGLLVADELARVFL
jgi:coproporphyrinogen III oxidase-like Fe-S oxidoreductase